MAFTEFCCRSGGSNLNAGTRTGNSTEPGTAAFKTYTSGTWVQSTRTFTPAGGANPTTDGIAVGDFVSIYPDAATVSPYIARITTVGSTTFVTSASAFAGTAPVDGALVTSAKIGGAWKGPNGAENFPFNFITQNLTDSALDTVRVNFKNDATYSISTGITHNVSGGGGIIFQGYTSTYADLGKATLDGSTNTIVLCTITNGFCRIMDFIISNNGTTGTNNGLVFSTVGSKAIRCVVHDIRGNGIALSAPSTSAIECEAYNCNTSNTSGVGGFIINANDVNNGCIRCISHDNGTSGTNAAGFQMATQGFLIGCVADTNKGSGIRSAVTNTIINCDLYNNGGDGITNTSTSLDTGYFENCNFVKNAGWGFNYPGGGTPYASAPPLLVNCGFGTGTAANTSGTITIALVQSLGQVNYASNVTPWVDPDNGDFRINLAAAINAGRGTFTETAASYSGAIGYPDIGASQHLESVSSSVVGVIGS